MSTDFDVVCDRHREYRHLGQRMGATYSFGYGRGDVNGQSVIAEWITEHLGCGLRIVSSDVDLPPGYRCVSHRDGDVNPYPGPDPRNTTPESAR